MSLRVITNSMTAPCIHGRKPLFSQLAKSLSLVNSFSSGGIRNKRVRKIPSYRKYHPSIGRKVVDPLLVRTNQLGNESLVLLATLKNRDAVEELLKRHIMEVDSLCYQEANLKFDEIESVNQKNMFLHTLPYKLGIGTATAAAFGSIPMVFEYNTVEVFNLRFVTADVPEPKDLETWLEVGAFSWSWMEPVLGQISFFLLCMQFARGQLQNIGLKPYTQKMYSLRANKLAQSFPQYDKKFIADYCKSVKYYEDN